MNSSPPGSGMRAWACDDPSGSVTLEVYTCCPSFVFQSIAPGSAWSFWCVVGHPQRSGMECRDSPGRFREGSRTQSAGREGVSGVGIPVVGCRRGIPDGRRGGGGAARGGCICRGDPGRERAPLQRRGLPRVGG